VTGPDPGFAILPGILSDAQSATLLGAFSSATLPRTRAGARNALDHPAASSIARDSYLLQVASDALGGEAFPFKATLFDKSQRANWLVVWHQDTALPLKARREVPEWGPWSIKAGVVYAHAPAEALSRVVALRVHLDDSTEENGPLRVLPGTHRLGVLTDSQIQELSRTSPSVECVVAKGGVLIMRPLLVHSSSKSSGSAPRRVLHIEYATSRHFGNALELGVAEQGSELSHRCDLGRSGRLAAQPWCSTDLSRWRDSSGRRVSR
jgi:hypothetical protein